MTHEVQPLQRTRVLAELEECASCREEYAALRTTLRLAKQGLDDLLPPEGFWIGYHSRLRERLETLPSAREGLKQSPNTNGLWLRLKKTATASFSVPVPIAAGLLLFVACSGFFLWHSRHIVKPGPGERSSLVETKTVGVPVIQEKVVIRVVYVARNRVRPRTRMNSGPVENRMGPNDTDNIISAAGERTAANLAGFKPTNQVKLTIIKGTYRDEK